MHIIAKHGNGCSDATCPAIYDTDDPGTVAFQGTALADPQALHEIGEVPPHEGVVLLPRSLIDSYRSTHDPA